jgi:hypothetical protein
MNVALQYLGTLGGIFQIGTTSFRDGAKHQTRNLEIPGSMLRIAPE